MSDGLFMPVYVWLWSSYCCLSALSVLSVHTSQKRKLVKMISQDLNCSKYIIYRVTMPMHGFQFNVDTTAYQQHENQNRNVRLTKIKLRFMSGCHIFIILLTSAKKGYALVCLGYICLPFFFGVVQIFFPLQFAFVLSLLGVPKDQ